MQRSLIIILCIFLLGGCAVKTEDAAEARKPVLPNINDADKNSQLRLVLTGEPSVLNPLLSTDTSSSAIENYIFEGLIDVDRNLKFKPLLAEKWTISDDGTKYLFYLKKDVYWHDGHKFNADDVIFTFKKVLDPKTNTVRRSNYLINEKPIKLKKINDHLVEISLPETFAPFLASMTMQIIPKHIYKQEDINRSKFNRSPIGTGPFKFKEWKAASHVILERNEDYHRDPALIKTIIYRIIPNTNTQLAALRRGEIDISSIPAKDYQKFLKIKKLNLFTYDQMFYTYLGYNLKNKHFKNKKVRQAIAYAINKDQLVETVNKGLATPAHAPCSPVSWAYTGNVRVFEYETDKARSLLFDAGYKLNDQGIFTKDGEPFVFEIMISQGSKNAERSALIIQQYLKDIGIKVEIRVMEWSALLKVTNAIQDPKDFDTVLIAWSLGVDPDAYSIWHSSQYPQGFNFIGYQNLEVDLLLIEGRRVLNQNKRRKIYQKIWKLIAEDQPYLFLWYPKSITAVSQKVGGYDSNPGPMGLIEDITEVFVTD